MEEAAVEETDNEPGEAENDACLSSEEQGVWSARMSWSIVGSSITIAFDMGDPGKMSSLAFGVAKL